MDDSGSESDSDDSCVDNTDFLKLAADQLPSKSALNYSTNDDECESGEKYDSEQSDTSTPAEDSESSFQPDEIEESEGGSIASEVSELSAKQAKQTKRKCLTKTRNTGKKAKVNAETPQTSVAAVAKITAQKPGRKENENECNNGSSDSETEMEDFVDTQQDVVGGNSKDRPTINWSAESATPQSIPFTGQPGLQVEIEPNATPYDYFRLLFTDEMVDMIVNFTNISAMQRIGDGAKKRAKYVMEEQMTPNCLLVYIAVLLHMGIIKKPSLCDYWSTDPLLETPQFGEQMSRQRFNGVTRNLALNDQKLDDRSDRLFKVRPILDSMLKRLHQVYIPEREVAIDESILLWKGHLHFNQYIPGKSHKLGIKLYLLAETSGLVYNIIPYSGTLPDPLKIGQTGAIVLHLMKPILDRGYSLYMDNFYNSVDLSKELLRRKTFVTGTIRQDRRDLPKNIFGPTGKKMSKEGEFVAAQCDDIFVSKFFDKREVPMITTEFKNEIVATPNAKGNSREKPNCIKQYNRFMGGVDKSDQMLSYYGIARRGAKWHRKLFLRLLDISILNSFTLYNKTHKKMSFKDFRMQIAKRIYHDNITKVSSLAKEIVPTEPIKLPLAGHKPLEGRESFCQLCSKSGVESKTNFFCKGCPDLPYLCFEPGSNRLCYLKHHDLL